jgi:hydrophobic/amphiphilic exporter-1 (mainly G- bacteria), HAE1 family
MSVITIGGLVTSTLLTLVIVPVVYCVVDSATLRVQELARALRARIRGRKAAAEGSPS